jgi:hypothetical protein
MPFQGDEFLGKPFTQGGAALWASMSLTHRGVWGRVIHRSAQVHTMRPCTGRDVARYSSRSPRRASQLPDFCGFC